MEKETALSPKAPPVRVIQTVEKVRGGLQRLNQKLVPPPVAMLEMISGFWLSQAIYAAAELGIADELEKGPLSLEELAHRLKVNAAALYRLLRALASRGIFAKRTDGQYELTPLADTLRRKSPYSIRGMAIFQCRHHWHHWADLVDCVRTGKNAIEKREKLKDPFEWFFQDPEAGAAFHEAMTNISDLGRDALIAAYPFGRFQRLIDVGGGHGRFLAAILAANPEVKGVVFDLPTAIAGAPALLEKFGVGERASIEAGSFFEAVPKGGDGYLLKHIIHDWEEERALTILKTLREAILETGKLLVIETVLPTHNAPHFGKFLDLEMLVTCTGRERTEQEYRELLRAGGFELKRVIPTAAPDSILEAKPI